MTGATPAPAPVIVGIGASAGGLEAFKDFFSHMPPDSGLAFVLVQHLDPDHKSMLAELLSRATEMPVVEIEDGMPATANKVFLIPPNATLRISKGVLRLETPAPPRQFRAPIDTFFMSLAEDQGENAICIVLSGSGSDGTLGLRAVKQSGGLTLAQSPEGAKYDSMPRSATATGAVDNVLPVDMMPQALMGYIEHRRKLEGDSKKNGLSNDTAETVLKICGTVKRRTGHDFREYKDSTIVRRIQRRMQILRIDNVEDYHAHLTSHAVEIDTLFKDFLIGVTSFFRDPSVFTVLSEKVIPKILETKADGETVRVWVPGCATGDEAYSIAMILREQIELLDVQPKVQVFATDIDETALDIARRGRYPDAISAVIPEAKLRRFFRHQNGEYRLAEEIREMCIFSTHSLIKDPPFSKLDIVSCRNLLIYLKPELQQRLLPLFHYALGPGGYLLLGTSENVSRHTRLFAPISKKWRIFKRREVEPRPLVQFPLTGLDLPKGNRPGERGNEIPQYEAPSIAERLVLSHHAPAYAIVNDEHELVYSAGGIDRFLELPKGSANLDILNLARPELRMDIRALIHHAKRDNRRVVREGMSFLIDGGRQVLRVTVEPLSDDSESHLLLVVFHDCGVALENQAQTDVQQDATMASNVRALETELRSTKEYLQTTTEELETSNEELKSSNEELMSMNEELQSSNEELETSKEELQSVNEELETVNTALTSKVDELSRTNSDLQNLLESTQIATIFLDRQLRVRNFTPAARNVFNFIEQDRGRRITDIAVRSDDLDVAKEVAQVLESLAVIEREVEVDDPSSTYVMRILPYRTVNDVIDGVVITFVDVMKLKSAQSEIDQLNLRLRNRVEELEAVLELVPVGIAIATLTDDPKAPVRLNRRAAQILKSGPNTLPAGSEALHYRFLRDGRPVAADKMPLEQAMRTGKTVGNFTTSVVFEDDTSADLSISAVPLLDRSGETRGALAAFEDISNLERARRDAEARAAQQDVIASLGTESLIGANASQIMQRAVKAATKVLDVEYSKILWVRPSIDDLLMVAGFGWEAAEPGSTTVPRADESQAGYTLEVGTPVIVEEMEREKRFEPPELLKKHGVRSAISTVIGSSEKPLGVLQVDSTRARQFSTYDVGFVQSLANVIAATVQFDNAFEKQKSLIWELQHRVKNTLSVVQAIVSQTLDSHEIESELRTIIDSRIQALGRAHKVLSDSEWRAVSLHHVVEAQIVPFVAEDRRNISTRGPGDILLGVGDALAISMAMHELVTNAAKYGALSSPDGRINISWTTERRGGAGVIRIDWVESDGPEVTPPREMGFGMELIQQGLKDTLEADVDIAFAAEGLKCRIIFRPETTNGTV